MKNNCLSKLTNNKGILFLVLFSCSTHYIHSKIKFFDPIHQFFKKKLAGKTAGQKPIENSEEFAINKTVISISNIVKDFDKQSSCNGPEWNNNLENACKCCLIKNAADLSRGKTATSILNSCLTNHKCDIKLIFEAEKIPYNQSKPSEDEIQSLIYKLYQKDIIVKEVSAHTIKLKSNGDFTEEAVIQFLSEASQEKKLKNTAFKKISCLKSTDIITEKGYQTKQLFLVSSTCPEKKEDFIFKEIASGTEEIIRLEKTFIMPELHPYFYPKKVINFPSFIMPSAYMSYVYNNNYHYMSLMPRSPGLLLSSLVKKYKEKSISQPDVEKAYYETGLALSNFHKHFMSKFKDKQQPNTLLNPTLIHGDAHQGNIFYDKDSNQVIFIDNERIASESPKNAFKDISYSLLITYKLFTPSDIKNDTKFFNNWILLSAKNFLKGYIDAYDMILREKLLNELIAKFGNESDMGQNLYQEYKKYQPIFDKIFDELKSEYDTVKTTT